MELEFSIKKGQIVAFPFGELSNNLTSPQLSMATKNTFWKVEGNHISLQFSNFPCNQTEPKSRTRKQLCP